MINWNDIKVEQEIAQERYQQIVLAQQVARAVEKEQPKVTFADQLRNWLTATVAGIGGFRKQSVQCCLE